MEPHAATPVLLVESDLFFTARILSALEKSGYSVRTARSAEDALASLADQPVALVIMNLAAPALGGVELVRRIKQTQPAPRVLAYLSHVRIPAVRDMVLEAGADKLCANSAVSLRLPQLVRDVLAGAGLREED